VSLPLPDFRGKITHETRAVLEAKWRATGVEYQETVRIVMHEWALREIEAASLITAAVAREGLAGEREGKPSGEDPE
jgi:hypothetical protein